MPLPSPEKERYTYADYLSWPDDERWEIIDGVIYNMAPAPSRRHQYVCLDLARQFGNFFLDKECEVYHAPFDVRFPIADEDDKDIKDVVQPDIVVVCDLTKLDDAGCRGTPDLIVEITSPSTAPKDNIKKLALYEKHGVKEYWIVHPIDKMVTVRLLGNDNKYGIPTNYEGKAHLEVVTFPGLIVDLNTVFKR